MAKRILASAPAILAVALAAGLACGVDRTTPTAPPQGTGNPPASPTPQPPAPVQPASLALTGSTSLQAVGETSQLTATASYPDGTTKDITREAQWTSTFPAIASISTQGVVTARALGITTVYVRYPVSGSSLFRFTEIVVTPAGTFSASGRAREPGQGGIAGVRVVHLDSGATTQTGADGYYFFGGLTGRPRFTFTKLDYEDVEADVIQNALGDTALQRVIHLTAGADALNGRLAPNDMEYVVADDTRCQPCRLVRLTGDGPTQVRLTWTGSSTLQIWVNGVAFTSPSGQPAVIADVSASAGDTLLFVGALAGQAGDYIPFNLAAVALTARE
jgi:hypothetical protein